MRSQRVGSAADLHEAGLVVRDRERRARGRPRDVWAVSPDARPDGRAPTGYAQLARWLVRAIVAGKTGVRGVEATGREIGRELARQGGPASPERQMHATLVAMGFQPRRELEADGGLTYCLGNCPYREAVRERQPVVRGLHRGMTRGLLDVIEPRTRLARFVPRILTRRLPDRGAWSAGGCGCRRRRRRLVKRS